MKPIIKQTIKQIQKLVNDDNFKTQYKTKETDFIRNRKINFSDTVLFVLGLSNTSFDFERINFCKVANIESVSNAALSKARDKVKFSAFRELLKQTQKLVPTTAVFKGYRVIAIDGIKGELPNTPEIMKKYKPSKTALYPMFHAVASFDVLNCKFIDAEFEMSPTNERKAAIKFIGVKKTEKLDYKCNVRKAAGIIIPQISIMLFSKQKKLSKIINRIVNIIKDFKSAVRPNRTYKRNSNSSRHSIYYRHNNMFCLS